MFASGHPEIRAGVVCSLAYDWPVLIPPLLLGQNARVKLFARCFGFIGARTDACLHGTRDNAPLHFRASEQPIVMRILTLLLSEIRTAHASNNKSLGTGPLIIIICTIASCAFQSVLFARGVSFF
ncbi:hypothetical protein TRVL_08843 [Trypanosoma vivax]|nr:hypothetical protein TRVL_08843 [Trypanosoma vivax]